MIKLGEKFKDILMILFIIVITLVFFCLVILKNDNYKIPWDAFDQQYPWINSTVSSFNNGEIPLWSDNYFSGFPIFEDPQVGTFYPGNIVLSLFANSETGFLSYKYIEISIIFHYILIGIFTYILCKNLNLSRWSSLFGAIVFEFCGYIACHAQHYSSIISLSWLPLSLCFLISIYKNNKKRNMIGFAITFSLSILGGHIQTALYNGIFLGLVTIILTIEKFKVRQNKKDALKFLVKILILFICAGLIAGIQLIPTLELMSNSTRIDMTYEEFSTNSNNPVNLITTIIPYFLDIDNSWFPKEPTETHLYLSIVFFIIMILFANTKRDDKDIKSNIIVDAKIWILLAIGFFLLSLGENTFLNRIMYLIPFINKLRRSVNYLYIVSLLLGILGAYALNFILENKENVNFNTSKKYIKILDIFFILFICIAYISLFMYNGNEKFEIIKNILKGLWITLIFINIVYYILNLYFNDKINKKVFSILLIAMLIIDMFTFNSNITPNAQRQNYNMDLSYDCTFYNGEVNEILRSANQEGARVLICGVNVLNAGGIVKVSDIWGYNPLVISDYEKYVSNFKLNLSHQATEQTNLSSIYTDMLSLKYILTTHEFMNNNESINLDKYNIIYDNGIMIILENKEYLPVYYFTNGVKRSESIDELYEKVSMQEYSPKEFVYSTEATEKEYKIPNEIKSEIISKSQNKIVLKVNTTSDTYLVTSQIMYDGWKAKVNGKPTTIDKVNGIFCGLEINAGENIIEIYYSPIVFYIGVISTVIGFIILIISIYVFKNKIEK